MTDHELSEIRDFLKNYDGPKINVMEVCGSHTAAIAKNGIPGMLSEKIHLISGPGCPVCVTPSAYIDRLIELALEPDTCVATFGDLIRVPGSERSLSVAKGAGAQVEMVYSPFDVITLAKAHPEKKYIFAAIGFETTTPVYADLIDTLIAEKIANVKLLTALKTMPAAIGYLCENGAPVDGFLAPGHVCVITGIEAFVPLAKKFQIPFAVAGFQGEEILSAIFGLVKAVRKGEVYNFYPSVVQPEGNLSAKKMVDQYFTNCDATWRGMGSIKASGKMLRPEYEQFDAGSKNLNEDRKINAACRCSEVLIGKCSPKQCPLFGKVCTPLSPQGACMVSTEGSCFSNYVNQ